MPYASTESRRGAARRQKLTGAKQARNTPPVQSAHHCPPHAGPREKTMRFTALPILLCSALACATNVLATPSTLVWIPSTDIQASGTTHIGYDTYTTPGSGGGNFTDYGVTCGINGNVEIGADYWTGTNDPWVFNAKVRLAQETAHQPAFAAGIYNFAGSEANAQNVAYALASKSFRGTRFTAGCARGRRGALGNDRTMVLLGVDRTCGDRWWVGADYQSGKSALGALSLGVAYKFAPNASAMVGYDWYNSGGIEDTFNVQVDIDMVTF